MYKENDFTIIKFSYCMFLESGIQHTDLNIKFQLCAQYLQHILLLMKYHLWGIVRKHKCCSCIVYSPHPPTSIFSQSVSHNPNTSQSNFAFKSSGLTQKGTVLPHTSSGKRENQKDSESRLTMQRGENSFCHCCHSEWDYSGDPRPISPLDLPCIQSLMGLCGCIMNALLSARSAEFVLRLVPVDTAGYWLPAADGDMMKS